MGRRGFREIRDGFHGHRCLWKQAEKLGKLWLHPVDVFFKVIDDLLLAFRFPIRIAVDGFAETGEILFSLGLGQLGARSLT